MTSTKYEQLLTQIESVLTDNDSLAIHELVKSFRYEQSRKSIKQLVAEYYGFEPNALDTRTRKRSISNTRQIAVWFYWNYSKMSLVEIANEFCSKGVPLDHSTMTYAIQKVNGYIETDEKFKININVLEGIINRYFNKEE